MSYAPAAKTDPAPLTAMPDAKPAASRHDRLNAEVEAAGHQEHRSSQSGRSQGRGRQEARQQEAAAAKPANAPKPAASGQ